MNKMSAVREILQKARLMQIATIHHNKPSVCTVWFAFDNDLSIYFLSSSQREHSIDIENDGCVAGAIVFDQSPDEPSQGIQFLGKAEKIEDHETENIARETYELSNIFSSGKIDQLISAGDNKHYFYKIVLNSLKLMDAKNFPKAPIQEITL